MTFSKFAFLRFAKQEKFSRTARLHRRFAASSSQQGFLQTTVCEKP